MRTLLLIVSIFFAIDTIGYAQDIKNPAEPTGIIKTFRKDGSISTFINYSVNENDTISYETWHGHITLVNIKDRTTKINYDSIFKNNGYYPGAVNMRRHYLSGKTSIHKEFDTNGTLLKEIHLRNNKRNGIYREWYRDGTPRIMAIYLNDTLAGHFTEYYLNGKLMKQGDYVKGLRNGTYKEFYEDGKLKWSNQYAHGEAGTMPEAYKTDGTKIEKKDVTYLDVLGNTIRNAGTESNIRLFACELFEDDTANARLLNHTDDSIYHGQRNHKSRGKATYMNDELIRKVLIKYVGRYENMLYPVYLRDSTFVYNCIGDLNFLDYFSNWTVATGIQNKGDYYVVYDGGNSVAYCNMYKDMSCDDVIYPDFNFIMMAGGYKWNLQYWLTGKDDN
jgi:antitoxin component YwqK of YwqJK toxin-antitoxin module